LVDDEGEIGRATQHALQIGATSPGVPVPVPKLDGVGRAAQHDVRYGRRIHHAES
jgi:hypothetical protein